VLKLNKKIKELIAQYKRKKKEIKKRLSEFKKLRRASNKRIFEELCYCILTANASAEMGIRTMSVLRHHLFDDIENIKKILRETRYRFPNKRAEYIVKTREYFENEFNFKIREKIESMKNKEELRDFFTNKNIKGIGYKEASHFLRNIGFSGYCILDKHILSCLHEFGVIKEIIVPKNKREYIEIENKMKEFAREIKIPIDDLDLLLWSRKTGKILK